MSDQVAHGLKAAISMRPCADLQNLIAVLAEKVMPLVALPIGVFDEQTQIDEHLYSPPIRILGSQS